MKRSAKPTGSASGGFRGFGASSSSPTLSYITPPPDLSGIPQNIVVPFKNLLKKDSTTKAKALDEIVGYAREQHDGSELEEAILEAWAQMYARVSIDNSRRVRELSHVLLFELMKSATKRMEKRIPFLVGPWLAGTYDRDKVVSRAAGDGLSSFLNTKEKERKFWGKCQAQIMDYATQAMLETPDTLSDARSSTKEDALSKYYRVASGSLSLILGLIDKVDLGELEEKLARYLKIDAVWSMAAAEETLVRKFLYQLLQVLLEKKPALVKPQLGQIGRILVSDSLKSSQTGSSTELLRALTKLTQAFPEVWGTKTHPLQRLRLFVERGSQNGSMAYWQELNQLLLVLPPRETSADVATAFLKALRAGVSGRLEPRSNALAAWGSYLGAFERFLALVNPKANFLEDNFFPLVRQYLHPTPEHQIWTFSAAESLVPKTWLALSRHADPEIGEATESELDKLRIALLSRMSTSLPEVSKEYKKSQLSAANESERWFTLVATTRDYVDKQTGESALTTPLRDVVMATATKVLVGAADLLSRRNYKPFGVAASIQAGFAKCPELCDTSLVDMLFPISSEEKVEFLVNSPSLAYLTPCLDRIASLHSERFRPIWEALIDSALHADLTISPTALTLLISLPNAQPYTRAHERLQKSLSSNWLTCAEGHGAPSSWDLCNASLTYHAVAEVSLTRVISDLIQHLDQPQTRDSAMRALEIIVNYHPTVVSQSQVHVELVTKLLGLTEIEDKSVSARAAALQSNLDQKSTGDRPLVGIIQRNLDDAGIASIGLDVLTQRALSALDTGSAGLEDLFPNPNAWLEQLSIFLRNRPNQSLSITSDIGGLYFLVKGQPLPAKLLPKRDAKGRSIPARMAIYTANLLSSGIPLSVIPVSMHAELLYLLSMTSELASDQLTVPGDGGLWSGISDSESIAAIEIQDLVTRSRKIVNSLVEGTPEWAGQGPSSATVVGHFIDLALQRSQSLSTAALYSAKVLSRLIQSLTEANGRPAKLDEWFNKLGFLKATPETVMPAAACLVGFGEILVSSEPVKVLCNRLVSDMTGLSPSQEKTLCSIALLNACLSVYVNTRIPVDNRRQTLALKQLTSWTDTPGEISSGLASETCKAILRILPGVKSVYGPYWGQAIDYCILLWTMMAFEDTAADRLPYVFASLKLINGIKLASEDEEASDDLIDSLKERAEDINRALAQLLKLTTEPTQPSRIVESLLARMADGVELERYGDLSDFYQLIASESRDIQTAAFRILHRAITEAQKQLSVDILLEKTDASLPDELLAILQDAPTLEAYPEDLLVEFPTPIRTYLLAWHLVFDAYSTASLRLRNDYSECLRKCAAMEPFLNFMFDVLGHSAGHELNLDREGFSQSFIREYDISLAKTEPDERSLHWLLINLLYLTLKYTPNLFRTWYLECRIKQTKNSIKPWLIKYFSPLIISDALDEVAKWVEEQEAPADDEQELVVKISKAAREVIAEYEVDEEKAAMAIRIPATFPLDMVEVVGINRVAVNEKKWQGWLLSTQGAIQFGNGGITDGLYTFRRNFIGTMKGQTECAICYSIVSSDKRLPDKACGTCHHSYHRVCLYKWFQNSGRNSCPLCRNPIDYIGSDTKRKT